MEVGIVAGRGFRRHAAGSRRTRHAQVQANVAGTAFEIAVRTAVQQGGAQDLVCLAGQTDLGEPVRLTRQARVARPECNRLDHDCRHVCVANLVPVALGDDLPIGQPEFEAVR